MKGATLVELDSAGRALLPSVLLQYAGISLGAGDGCVVSGLGEKIEVWNAAAYDTQVLGEEGDDFGSLAEDVRRDIEPPSRP